MDIETEEKCMCILYRLIEYYPLFEKPIEEGGICDAVRIFLAEDLMIVILPLGGHLPYFGPFLRAHKKHKNANKRISDVFPLTCF